MAFSPHTLLPRGSSAALRTAAAVSHLVVLLVLPAWLLSAGGMNLAQAQSRISFPTAVQGGAVPNGTSGGTASFAPNSTNWTAAGGTPMTVSNPVTMPPPYQSGYQAPPAGSPYMPAQYTTPQGGYNYNVPSNVLPPMTMNQGQPMTGGATFQGTVAPAPSNWDPYSSAEGTPLGSAPPYQPAQPYQPYQPYPPGQPAPGATSPNVLFPNGFGSVFDPGAYSPQQPPAYGAVQYQRLFQEIRIEDTFLAGEGQNELNWNMAEISATAVFPFFYQQAPLLVTPGFAVNNISTPGDTPDAALPPRLYDAYIDTVWKPQITTFLSADLGLRIGVYSDFDHVDTDSIRIMGRGLGVVAVTPNMQLAAGIVYFDRLTTKLLPAGGVIWTSPTKDVRLEILFPRPKLSKKLSTVGTTEWWGYLGGEYGGGSWTVHLDNGMGFTGSDRIDINDIRVTAGLEWHCCSGPRGWIETGYVFNRQVVYQTNTNLDFDPNNTWMVRGGIAY